MEQPCLLSGGTIFLHPLTLDSTRLSKHSEKETCLCGVHELYLLRMLKKV
jgi:hypothetical protein